MKIFVTGGTGNIGQHVTLALAARGHQVELLTRTPERIPAFQSMENVHVVKGCLQEPETMTAALAGCDAVIHIALGWSGQRQNWQERPCTIRCTPTEKDEAFGIFG